MHLSTKSMFKTTLFWFFLSAALILSSCSGSDDGKSVTEVPVLEFSSPSSVTVLENQLDAVTLHAVERDGNDVNYSIEGSDASAFDINRSSGVVTFKNAPDYETKYKYLFTAKASNGTDSIAQDMILNIADLNDPFLVARLQDDNRSIHMGLSVSIDGNYTVVSASGFVYLYKIKSDRSVQLLSKFQADDTDASNCFGISTTVFGRYIVVGDYLEDSSGVDAGAAYLFKIEADENVTQLAKIQATGLSAGDGFGSVVAMEGDHIVVIARSNSNIPDKAGIAYLFELQADDNVTYVTSFTASNEQADAYFGSSVDIDADHIVVGAVFEDTTEINTGSVYLFKIATDGSVAEVTKILPSDIQASDTFGASVAMKDGYIAVGATGKDTTVTDAGSVYLYTIAADETLTQIATIRAPDAARYDRFGNAVSMDDRNILIGAASANEIGSAYLYKLDASGHVVYVKTITSAISRGDDTYYGSSVSISGTMMIIGAPYEDIPDYDSGRAYLFDSEPLERIYIYNQAARIVIDEGTQKGFKIEAGTPNGGLTYTLSGTDSSSFVLAQNRLYTDPVLDYELPQDTDSDNLYEISVDLQDSKGNRSAYPLTVEIQDRHYVDLAKIQASDPEAYDSFAKAVAIDGNYTVVGAPYEDTSASDAGSVYVYKKALNGDMIQIAKLQADDAEKSDRFGSAVAVDGAYIVVGASDEDTTATGAGSVYIFKVAADDTVSQVAKVQAADASYGSHFGVSVSISGQYIAVGADDSSYILKIAADDTVTQLDKVTGSDTTSSDNFGSSVAISGDYIVVGAWTVKSAYIFKIADDESISQIAKIASDVTGDTYFGQSVAIAGVYIVIGAKGEADSSGSAYIYKIAADDTVSLLAKTVAEDRSDYDQFGGSVSIDVNYVVIGAQYENATAYGAGSAYLFEIAADDTVSQVDKIQAFDADVDDNFGSAVSISGDTVVIGSRYEDTTGVSDDDRTSLTHNAGSAYLYTKDPNQ